ncbi:MAG TPA: hypothetical protein HA256_04860 [Methanoregulaceae archaeon]|nr:hypothetical protein [Methanoregulaceae archaeon]
MPELAPAARGIGAMHRGRGTLSLSRRENRHGRGRGEDPPPPLSRDTRARLFTRVFRLSHGKPIL